MGTVEVRGGIAPVTALTVLTTWLTGDDPEPELPPEEPDCEVSPEADDAEPDPEETGCDVELDGAVLCTAGDEGECTGAVELEELAELDL